MAATDSTVCCKTTATRTEKKFDPTNYVHFWFYKLYSIDKIKLEVVKREFYYKGAIIFNT